MTGLQTIEAINYETGKPVRIEIRDTLIGKISEVPGSPQDQLLFVAPGLIDNQVNGYSGVDFSDSGLTTDRMIKAVWAIRSDGVTSFVPTVITNSHENLLRNFKNLASALNDKEVRDSIPGFHLEGPYISSEEGYFGCHPSTFIRKPSWDEFAQYQEAADGNIIQVTVGPEVEGCINFIKQCTKNNIKVAIGHTNASADQINIAADNGARLSTHLGNGCANLIDRHRNPLWPQLANDLLTPSIIADGHHLLPEEIRVFYKVKGPGGLVLTSDVNHLIGMKPGKYMYFGSEVIYTADGLVKNPVLNCLAGASMPLKTGVGNVMKYTGCSLAVAINMAAGNLASIYGLSDRGLLTEGKRADLILFEKDHFRIRIKQVWAKGKLIMNVME
jgi:N-acetylglucosamine-6-phosphate deacetylase